MYDDSTAGTDHELPNRQHVDWSQDALTDLALRTGTSLPATLERGEPACSRPLRLWSKAAVAGHFTVCETDFVDHTVTDQTSVIHSSKTTGWADNASATVLRRDRKLHQPNVRLQQA